VPRRSRTVRSGPFVDYRHADSIDDSTDPLAMVLSRSDVI